MRKDRAATKSTTMSLSESAALLDSLEFAGTMLERHDIADCSTPGLLEVGLLGGSFIPVKILLLKQWRSRT